MLSHRLVSVLMLVASLAGSVVAEEGEMPAVLEAAKARAAAENKPLVIEFSGRTWCPPCKALFKEVISSDAFARFAADRIVIHLDYPVRSERTPEKIAADPELARLMAAKTAFNIEGFPTVILLAPDGSEIRRLVGYQAGSGPEAWIAQLTGEK